jgi:hypothetical protein
MVSRRRYHRHSFFFGIDHVQNILDEDFARHFAKTSARDVSVATEESFHYFHS